MVCLVAGPLTGCRPKDMNKPKLLPHSCTATTPKVFFSCKDVQFAGSIKQSKQDRCLEGPLTIWDLSSNMPGLSKGCFLEYT